MTEELDFSEPPHSDAKSAPAAQPSAAQAGAALRRAREAKGVHLVALASALKVPTKTLEHLEAGEFEALPDLVFAKALASSVCRHLGVDAAEVLQWWPVVNNPTLAKASPAGPIKPTVFDPYPDRPRPLRRVVLALGFVAILIGLVWVWLAPQPVADVAAVSDAKGPDVSAPPGDVALTTVTATVAADVPAPSLAADGASTAAVAVPSAPEGAATPSLESPATSTSVAVATVNVQGPAAGSAVGEPSRAGAAPRDVVVVPPVAVASPASGGEALPEAEALSMRFDKDSWLQLRNGQGRVLVARVVAAGQTLQWPLADGPWSVVLGNAAGVVVKVAGQTRDLGEQTQRGVARFVVE